MESLPITIVVAFLAGVLVGYGIRAFISARHRARARRYDRRDFVE
jgi:predicted benzoate:H+ symporter BenE